MQGCLKDTLFELSECVQWGLVEPAFAEQQRINLYNQVRPIQIVLESWWLLGRVHAQASCLW